LNNAKEQITTITDERNNLEELYKQLNQELQTQRHSSTVGLDHYYVCLTEFS
jgi:hypothetical protein